MLSSAHKHSAKPYPTLRGITISDLHLLAERRPLESWETSKQIWREQFDLCVLNGDIFDFRWAQQTGVRHPVESAREWLTTLLEPHARARFVVLMGNHDATPAYRDLLNELSEQFPQLVWREHWFILGHRVFCHGDMPDASGLLHNLRAYRTHHSSLRPPRPLAHRVYATATRLGVTGSVPRMLPWRRQCARIDALLRTELKDDYDGITDVYVGHTHVHFLNRIVNGKRFHNGGAPLPGGRFVPLPFEFTPSELPSEWHE